MTTNPERMSENTKQTELKSPAAKSERVCKRCKGIGELYEDNLPSYPDCQGTGKLPDRRQPKCDCENPEPESGAALISNACPIHNYYPQPPPEPIPTPPASVKEIAERVAQEVASLMCDHNARVRIATAAIMEARALLEYELNATHHLVVCHEDRLTERAAEITRLRGALDRTPTLEDLREWEKWINGPLAIQQIRQPGSVSEGSPGVQRARDWVGWVLGGAHQAALEGGE